MSRHGRMSRPGRARRTDPAGRPGVPLWARAFFIVACLVGSLVVAGVASAQDPSPSDAGAGAAASPAPSGSPAASAQATPTPVPVVLPFELIAPTVAPASLVPGPTPMAPIAHPSDGQSNTCADCHASVSIRQERITDEWKASVHGQNGIGCADCHGGDPTSDRMGIAMDRQAGFIGRPDRIETIKVCGSCHSDPNIMKPFGLPTDEFAKYWTSVHGQQLLKAQDTQVAICIDCHGSHDVKKTSDPTAKVYSFNVPDLCATCHSDQAKMAPYGIPTDQYDIYKESVHGKALLTDKDVRAPSCASCHGSHDAKPPTDTTVVNVCGSCHTATEDLYKQSRHAELGAAAPRCWTCHGTHDVSQPSSALFFHPTPPDYQCSTCHNLESKTLRIETGRFKDAADRRCDTCHHPDSDIYAQAQAIHDSLTTAQSAYDDAQARIDQAAGLGMIVSDADVTLADAKTSLIKAQAAVHTTKLTLVDASAKDAEDKAAKAAAIAQAKLDDGIFRRQAMVVVVIIVLLNAVALFIVKKWIERRREGEAA